MGKQKKTPTEPRRMLMKLFGLVDGDLKVDDAKSVNEALKLQQTCMIKRDIRRLLSEPDTKLFSPKRSQLEKLLNSEWRYASIEKIVPAPSTSGFIDVTVVVRDP